MANQTNLQRGLPNSLNSKPGLFYIFITALAYFAGVSLTLHFFPLVNNVFESVWPPAGISLAAFLLHPRRQWPILSLSLFVAGVFGNVLMHITLFNSLGFMTANILESLGSAWLITRWNEGNVRFNHISDALALIAAATGVNACSALLGAGVAALSNPAPFIFLWMNWWIADGFGILLITPFLVAWIAIPYSMQRIHWFRVTEWVAFLLLWFAVSRLSFDNVHFTHPLDPNPYMLLALLSWAALRLDLRSITLALVVLAYIALTSDSVRLGPLLWGGVSPHDRLLLVQVFLAVASATGYLLAASSSEAKTAEKAARNSQSRMQALADNIPKSMVYRLMEHPGGSMRFFYVSAGIKPLTGYTAQEVLSDPLVLYHSIVEEDRPLLIAARETSLQTMSPMHAVIRFKKLDGEIRWMQFSSTPHRQEDGCISRDGILIDITDLKNTEESLRQTQEILSNIIEGTPDAVYTKDCAGRYQLANTATLRYLNLPLEEVLGKDDTAFFSPNDASFIMEGDQKVITEAKLMTYEEKITPDGNEHTFLSSKGPLIDAAGNVTGIFGIARDITGRKQMEEALRESEERLRDIMFSMADWVWEVDGNGVYTYSSQKGIDFFGRNREDIIGKTPFDFMLPEEAKRVAAIFSEIMANKAPVKDLENWNINKNGESFCLLTNGVPLLDKMGNLKGYRGVDKDITGYKQIEKENTERHHRIERQHAFLIHLSASPKMWINDLSRALQTTAEYAAECFPVERVSIWSLSADSHELHCLDLFERSLDRHSAGAILHESEYADGFAALKAAHCVDAHNAQRDPRTAGYAGTYLIPLNIVSMLGAVIRQEDRMIGLLSLEHTGTPRHWYPDEIFFACALADHVSLLFANDKRKRTEEALRESEEKYRCIVETTTNWVWSVNLQGVLTFSNHAVESMLGYTVEEVLNSPTFPLMYTDDVPWIRTLLVESAQQKTGWSNMPVRWLHKDGSIRYIESSAQPIFDAEGNINGFTGIDCDITERKLAEKIKIEKERLNAIAEVASGVAHNINNSLQVISGNIDIALLEENVPEQVKEYLDTIQTAAGDAAERVLQLQRFSRKNQKEYEFSAVNLHQVLDETIEQANTAWKGKLERKDGEISIQKIYGNIPSVDGNFAELKSVFYNLIKNSMEAMPQGGSLSLETGFTKNEVYVRVIDTGAGMDEETIKRIFQPFFTTKGYDLGRGLGMITVLSIIQDHGGEVIVKESIPGKGTAVEVLLPIGNMKTQSLATEKPLANKIHARVLFVDDEKILRDGGKRILERLGHQADTAASGEEALLLLENNNYDLIISDIGMPTMNGWELAEKIKGRHTSAKFAFISGWGADITNEDKENFGIDYILEKPVNINTLKSMIDEVLQAKYSYINN